MNERVYDLEERLLEYAAAIIDLTEKIKPSRAGNHVGDQLLRAGTSPLFNHGEAEASESRKDFLHKLGVCLKELRECHRALRLLVRANLIHSSEDEAGPLLGETDELIRICVASIRTARGNAMQGDPRSSRGQLR